MQHEILEFPKREISMVELIGNTADLAKSHNWDNPTDEAEELMRLKFMGLALAFSIIVFCYEKGAQ